MPGAKPSPPDWSLDVPVLMQRLCTTELHQAFNKLRHSLGRLGVPVLCAAHAESVSWILHFMRRLRIQERGVR
jgi:hypothetical protein